MNLLDKSFYVLVIDLKRVKGHEGAVKTGFLLYFPRLYYIIINYLYINFNVNKSYSGHYRYFLRYLPYWND